MISQSGDMVFEVAVIWLVLLLTGSAFATGATVAAELAPAAIFSPFVGVLVDRFDRRLLYQAATLGQGALTFALALLYLAHALDLSVVVAVVFGISALAVFPRAIVPATIPRMVSKDDLMPANALYSLSSSTNQLAGLSLGGVVVALAGVEWPILYDSATFLLTAILVLFVARAYLSVPGGASTPAGPGFLAGFREGFAELKRHADIRGVIVLGFALNIFGGVLLALIAPYARLTLGGTAETYGFLLAAVAVGTLVGAFALGAVRTRHIVGKLILVGMIGVGAAFVGLALLPIVDVAYAIAFGLGVGLAAANLPIQALFQAKIPPELLGRVNGIVIALLVAPQPVGAILAGAFARPIGVGPALGVSGGVILAITAVGAAVLPAVRNAAY